MEEEAREKREGDREDMNEENKEATKTYTNYSALDTKCHYCGYLLV